MFGLFKSKKCAALRSSASASPTTSFADYLDTLNAYPVNATEAEAMAASKCALALLKSQTHPVTFTKAVVKQMDDVLKNVSYYWLQPGQTTVVWMTFMKAVMEHLSKQGPLSADVSKFVLKVQGHMKYLAETAEKYKKDKRQPRAAMAALAAIQKLTFSVRATARSTLSSGSV